MNRNLYLRVLITGMCFSLVSMEEKASLEKVSIEFKDLPDELLALILSRLVSGRSLSEEIASINEKKLVDKRFNALVNDIVVVQDLINYWSKKYNIPQAAVAVIWATPGAKKWLEIQDLQILSQRGGNERGLIKLMSPLMLAAESGNLDIVKLLVEKGVNINEIYEEASIEKGVFENPATALTFAVQKGHLDVVDFLINKGADVMQLGPHDESLLFHAIESGNKELVQYLINKGIDVNRRRVFPPIRPLEYAGKTLRRAKESDKPKYQEIINILEKNGAQ